MRAPEPDRPFARLAPEVVLDAAASAGLAADGRLLALNSYENRVYQLGLTPPAAGLAPPGEARVVLKFYRPARWSDAQIGEEHAFTAELAAAELPVAMPLTLDGQTLLRFGEFRFAVFPWQPGRAPDLDAPEARLMLGRALARLHRIGRLRGFECRVRLTVERFGRAARSAVLDSELLPDTLHARYAQATGLLLDRVERAFEAVGPVAPLRIHGDCHLGNLLWNQHGPLFVDLDDCMMGPAVQDLWMMLSGGPGDQQRQWAELLEGYQQFADFDFRELRLIEPLRALRMLHHGGWVAQRWHDPAFPRAFPWFGEQRYWESHITDLAEQATNIDDPPLLQ